MRDAILDNVIRGVSEDSGLLRFLTCGSVDDGKSTLIGRLLYDLDAIPLDQLKTLERSLQQSGGTHGEIEFGMLLDGLEAEQEQGITIDVAYRYFHTQRRSYIVADTPGHEQYTRNMATGASVSDVAVILVDSRKGILKQTRRHSLIASYFGIKHIVLAVNKIDLMGYSEEVFRRIRDEYTVFARGLEFRNIVAIPISALKGDNVVDHSEQMPWYDGPTLLEQLETIDVESDRRNAPLRVLIQWVCRPDDYFRGFAGVIASGVLRRDDSVIVAGSSRKTKVGRIVNMSGDRDIAVAGDAVMLVLADEIDVSRGDILCHPGFEVTAIDQVAAHILWFSEVPMIPGRSYLMKIGTRTLPAEIIDLKYRIDVDTFAHAAAKTLAFNEIGFCNLMLSVPTAIDPFDRNRDTGSFILIDRLNNATVGAGMVLFSLRRSLNVHPQLLDVDKGTRARIKNHQPAVLWFTGLSGAGKSTIANLVERKLNAIGCHTYMIDGDNIRHGLNRDLGFTEVHRVENIRRVSEVSRLFVDAGLIVIVSLISPYLLERRMARERVGEGEFIEIFVDTPIEVCRERDPKGLYRKAAQGDLINFTGIDSPYEQPESPEIRISTLQYDAERLAEEIVAHLRAKCIIPV